MEDISLNDVNNLVVALRPKVAQAKVHLVRHLMRQAAKLDKRCTDKEKSARRAQRMREEVTYMKNLEKDEVAKFAIGSSMTLDEFAKGYVGEKEIDCEARARVRLANFKTVRAKVKEFVDGIWDGMEEEDKRTRLQNILGKLGLKQQMKSPGIVKKKKEKVNEKNKELMEKHKKKNDDVSTTVGAKAKTKSKDKSVEKDKPKLVKEKKQMKSDKGIAEDQKNQNEMPEVDAGSKESVAIIDDRFQLKDIHKR